MLPLLPLLWISESIHLPRKNPCFDAVVGLAWSNGVATSRASHDRQVKGDNPDSKGYPGPLHLELSMGLIIPPYKKFVLLRSF